MSSARIEAEHGIAGFGELARQSAPNAFFRFLHYPGERNPNAIIAEPHVDHSGFTFHLYETTDGCERLTLDTNDWVSLPVAEGKAAAFASMQTLLVSRGEIKGLCHRVVANNTSAKVGRYAIVCFIALATVPGYNRRTHGRLQEMPPGFNYTMPQKRLNDYLKTSGILDYHTQNVRPSSICLASFHMPEGRPLALSATPYEVSYRS